MPKLFSDNVKIRVTAVIIGVEKIEHTINIPSSMKSYATKLGKEFLMRQYPVKFANMVDINVIDIMEKEDSVVEANA